MFEPMAALAIGWALCGCVGPIRGVDIEVGTTVQHANDPPRARVWSKGCMGEPPMDCGPVYGSAPVYGVGFGIVTGAALDFRVGPLTLRPYLGTRYEQYFEREQLTGSHVSGQIVYADTLSYAPTHSVALETGLGLAMSRLELRPTFGIGGLSVTGHGELTRVVTVGFSLSTRVLGGLLVGTFFHYNLSPYPDEFAWKAGFKSQGVSEPVLGLEAAYRFKAF